MSALPKEQADEIRNRRAQGVSWLTLVKETGLSLYVLKCTVDPNFQSRLAAAVRANRERRRNGYVRPSVLKKIDQQRMSDPDGKNKFGHAAVGIYVSSISIPWQVEVMREKLVNYRHTETTAALMGDPPIWRSALGKKNGCR